MRVLAIVHQRDAGPGVFGEAIRDAGGRLDEWTLAERPAPPSDPLSYDAVFVLGGAMNVDEGERHGWIALKIRCVKRSRTKYCATRGRASTRRPRSS